MNYATKGRHIHTQIIFFSGPTTEVRVPISSGSYIFLFLPLFKINQFLPKYIYFRSEHSAFFSLFEKKLLRVFLHLPLVVQKVKPPTPSFGEKMKKIVKKDYFYSIQFKMCVLHIILISVLHCFIKKNVSIIRGSNF